MQRVAALFPFKLSRRYDRDDIFQSMTSIVLIVINHFYM